MFPYFACTQIFQRNICTCQRKVLTLHRKVEGINNGMKKFILFIAAMMLSISAMADGHLSFRGIEITGSMARFTATLETETGWVKDTELTETEDDVYYQTEENGLSYFVEVLGTPLTNTVYMVKMHYIMYAPETEEAKKNGFDAVAEPMTQLFGNPTSEREYKRTYKPDFGKVSIELEDLGKKNMVHIQTTLIDDEGDQLFEKENHSLVFAETKHDFGTVYTSKDYRYASFEFENTAPKPLKITRVQSPSGKISGEYPKESIMPGDKGKVVVKWRMDYKWSDFSNGREQTKYVIVHYTDGQHEFRQRLSIQAKIYFPLTEVYDRQIGALRINSHDQKAIWNYKLCERKGVLEVEYANLTEKNLEVAILYHDSVTSITHTLVDEVLKPGDEHSFKLDMGFDGQKKIETASLEFKVNKKREALEPVSIILWEEVDKATRDAWEKSVHYKYQTQGCKKETNFDYYWDDYGWWYY